MEEGKLETGTCARWKNTFGFVSPDTGGPDLFTHYSDLKVQGYRQLEPGQRVKYRRVVTDRGIAAVDVEVVE